MPSRPVCRTSQPSTGEISMQHQSLSDRDHPPAVGGSSLRRFFNALVPQTQTPENAEFLRALIVLGGALFALTLLTYFLTMSWTWPFPRDKATLVLGRDFLNLWMYGRAVGDADPAGF